MKQLSLAIALALCLALPASAQMYKWVDANGKVQYSDKPPPSNIKAEKLRAPPPAPSAPAGGATASSEAKAGTPKDKDATKAGAKTAAEQEQAFRKRQLDAAKAQEGDEKKQAQARDKAENCKRLKATLANLQAGGRQMRVDEKGERAFLDEAQVAKETATAQQEAAAACP